MQGFQTFQKSGSEYRMPSKLCRMPTRISCLNVNPHEAILPKYRVDQTTTESTWAHLVVVCEASTYRCVILV